MSIRALSARVRFQALPRSCQLFQRNLSSSKTPESVTSTDTTSSTSAPVTKGEVPKRTPEEQDAALMEAYREKFGGDITATFEDGQATEMRRGVRKNMFRYI